MFLDLVLLVFDMLKKLKPLCLFAHLLPFLCWLSQFFGDISEGFRDKVAEIDLDLDVNN